MPRKPAPSRKSTHPATLLCERYNWKQVVTPKVWRPTFIGEELVGFYGGKSQRRGSFGAYDVIIVHVPQRGALIISGTQALQLIDASGIAVGGPVRFIHQGSLDLPGDRTMKCFELFVPDDEQPLAAEHLPRIKGH